MTQPTDRLSDVPAAGELDLERGEFWIENPWRMTTRSLNVSAYEPNQVANACPDPVFGWADPPNAINPWGSVNFGYSWMTNTVADTGSALINVPYADVL